MDEDGVESMTVAIPGRGLTRVSINTSKIQDKVQASLGVYEHASALGAAFGPYVKTCLDSFLELVAFKYSCELRAVSAQTLAAVFEAACLNGENVGMSVPSEYLPAVAKAIAKQIVQEENDERETLCTLASALSAVCYSVYSRMEDYKHELLGSFTNDDAHFVVKQCMGALATCFERRSHMHVLLKGSQGALSGDEILDYERNLQTEEELLTPLVDSVGYNLKFLKQRFLPIFESQVAPVLGSFLSATCNDARAQLAAVCLFDDCVEHCGTEAAAKYAPQLVATTVNGLANDAEPELKRACIYGIAQMSRYAPSTVLLPFGNIILPKLFGIVSQGKEEYDNDVIFENAVSALASLVLFDNAIFKAGLLKYDLVLRTFLHSMPLQEDPDEASICITGLCDLVEKGTINVRSDFVELVRIIGETMVLVTQEELRVSSETVVRLAGILFQLQREVPSDRINQAFNLLPQESQWIVNRVMQEYGHHFANVVSP